MERKLIVALHGFLGLPSDWNFWIQKYAPHDEVWALNLWEHPELNSSLTLNSWTAHFLAELQVKRSVFDQVELWGYSMGGRMALGALLQAPELFNKAVILSANPGLELESDRQQRLERDLEWSKKFLIQEWSSLLEQWNQQPVLKSSVDNSVHRPETLFDRRQLSQALLNWSLAYQPNYWLQLDQPRIPIDWHVGERDTAYVQIAKRAHLMNRNIRIFIHANQGHRLLGLRDQNQTCT